MMSFTFSYSEGKTDGALWKAVLSLRHSIYICTDGDWCFSFFPGSGENDNMPQKQKAKSWMELKQAGNECFKTGQYGDATNFYSQAIKELEKASEYKQTIT